MKEHGKGLVIVEDDVATKEVGRFEEKFHWFLASKGEVVVQHELSNPYSSGQRG